MYEETESSKPEEIKCASIRAQDIPVDIKRQRMLLQDFYTAWKKHKLGSSEETKHRATSTTHVFLKRRTPTEIGLQNCEKLISSSDNLTSSFSQLSNAFLLFANAYPRHAPKCYKLAEFCFEMAAFSSRALSALWKVTHGFTLSSVETAIDKLDFPITNMLLSFHAVFLSFHHLYSEYVKHVAKMKAFERDEEFQIGYEQPPMESQILAFSSLMEVSEDKLKAIILRTRRLLQRPSDPPKQEEVSEEGGSKQAKEAQESDEPDPVSEVLLHISVFLEDLKALCRSINAYTILDS
jgi:hypothetical protein